MIEISDAYSEPMKRLLKENLHFYRFTEPIAGYPVMIELFSKIPDHHLGVSQGIISIHIDDWSTALLNFD